MPNIKTKRTSDSEISSFSAGLDVTMAEGDSDPIEAETGVGDGVERVGLDGGIRPSGEASANCGN